jgi:transposase
MTKSSETVSKSTIAFEIKIAIITVVIKLLSELINKTVAMRIVCVVLFVADLPHNRIKEVVGLSLRTIGTLKKAALAGDIKSLFQLNARGMTSNLADIETEILEKVSKNNYFSIQEIVDMIEEEFGIKTSLSAVKRLLKKLKIRRLKCGSLPAKADPNKQRAFYYATLLPLMQKAKAGAITLLFVDAAHFVMGCGFLGCVYGVARRVIRTFSGRKRYNVLGALNFVTKRLTTVTNSLYISSVEVCDLLRKVADEFKGTPIYMIMDNARYQKCNLVLDLAKQLGINLVFIPPYSPNLNLIERFWKHVKGRLRTKHYDDFNVFCETIDSLVSYDNIKDQIAVNRIISEKVQLFDNIEPLNEYTCVPKKAA